MLKGAIGPLAPLEGRIRLLGEEPGRPGRGAAEPGARPGGPAVPGRSAAELAHRGRERGPAPRAAHPAVAGGQPAPWCA
ncbi:MAG: hypothetical protein MZV63_37410 [Marinilabiliales bacterium]|nr:hypothetical protein [Marinilabiliales bacterium]